MVGQDTAGKVTIGERGLGERVGEGKKDAKGARGLGGEGVRVEKEAEESERWGLEQVVGVRGGLPTHLAPWVRGVCDGGEGGGRRRGKEGLPETLPAPWVRGACDGWDEGEESIGLFSPWEKAWGESTIGGVRPPSYLPPRTTMGGTEVGEDGASVCGDRVVRAAAA